MGTKRPFYRIFAPLFLIFLYGCAQVHPEAAVTSTAVPPTPTPLVSEPTGTTVPATPTPLFPLTPTPSSLIPSSTPSPTPAFTMCSPLEWETIPELWEIVSNPFHLIGPGREDGHHGVDFAHYRRKGHLSMWGEEIDAVLPGRVAASIQDRLPYGNMVIIETPYDRLPVELASTINMTPSDSLYLLYAHMQDPPLVSLSDAVSCGQALGAVGASGMDIVNEHLHLETRLGPPGVAFTSMAYYDTTANQDEMAAYVRWRSGGEFRPFDPLNLFAAYLAGAGQPVPTLAPYMTNP